MSAAKKVDIEEVLKSFDQTRGQNPPIVTGSCIFPWEGSSKCTITEQHYCMDVLKGNFVKNGSCPGGGGATGPVPVLPETQFGPNPTLDDVRKDLVAKFNNLANFMDSKGQTAEQENAAQRVRDAIAKTQSRK
jgi:hypothetical protein